MTLQWFISWPNLIFVAPFALALLYLGLYTMSGITFGDADADADVGGDFGADADVDGDVHLDAGVDHDVDAGADGHVEGAAHAESEAGHDTDSHDGAPAGHGPMMAALQWLGVGRVPISIVLMVLLLAWGWFGFVANVILQPRVAEGVGLASISVPVALVCSLVFTKFVVVLVARWLPTCETTARRRHELLGSVGEVVFAINEKFGMSAVRDTQGDLYQVPCRVGDGEPVVAKGGHVKLVEYNAKQGIFRVIPWEHSPSGAPAH